MQIFWKSFGSFLKTKTSKQTKSTKHTTAYIPGVALLRIYSINQKLRLNKNLHWMFIAVYLYVIASSWEQHRYPLTNESFSNCGTSTLCYYDSRVITRHKLLIHAITWVNLEGFMLSGRKNQFHKITYTEYVFT